MINAYHKENFRHAIREEVVSYIREKTHSTLVLGFSEIQSTSDAIIGGPRVAGFMESYDNREWCLPLTAKNTLG